MRPHSWAIPGIGMLVALALTWAPAQAAASPPTALAKISAALTSVRSFEIVSDGKSTERQPSVERVVTIGVRRGGVLWLDVTTALRPSGAGDTTIDEVVVHGTQVCERGGFSVPLPLTSAFKCRTDPAAAASYLLGADPTRSLAKPGDQFVYGRGAARQIGRQRCQGYAFTQHTAFTHAQGTLYVSPSTWLPCEEDMRVVQPPLMAAPNATSQRITVHMVSSWSHYNDRSLHIPATA